MFPQAMFGLGVPELLIILAVVLLLFGGSRLAGLGKSTGRALKEFKEETKGLRPEDKQQPPSVGTGTANPYETAGGSTFVPTPHTDGPAQPGPYVAQPPQNGAGYPQAPQNGPSEHDARRDV
jgi:sec-independent protein translocase protein TatA